MFFILRYYKTIKAITLSCFIISCLFFMLIIENNHNTFINHIINIIAHAITGKKILSFLSFLKDKYLIFSCAKKSLKKTIGITGFQAIYLNDRYYNILPKIIKEIGQDQNFFRQATLDDINIQTSLLIEYMSKYKKILLWDLEFTTEIQSFFMNNPELIAKIPHESYLKIKKDNIPNFVSRQEIIKILCPKIYKFICKKYKHEIKKNKFLMFLATIPKRKKMGVEDISKILDTYPEYKSRILFSLSFFKQLMKKEIELNYSINRITSLYKQKPNFYLLENTALLKKIHIFIKKPSSWEDINKYLSTIMVITIASYTELF